VLLSQIARAISRPGTGAPGGFSISVCLFTNGTQAGACYKSAAKTVTSKEDRT